MFTLKLTSCFLLLASSWASVRPPRHRIPSTLYDDSPDNFQLSCAEPPSGIEHTPVQIPSDRTWRPSDSNRWPDKNVPWMFVGDTWSDSEKDLFRSSLAQIEAISCATFTEHTTNPGYVLVVSNNEPGCWSYLGFNSWSEQQLNVQRYDPGQFGGGSCMYDWIIIHEVFHALGTHHEQVRHDRDQYIEINFSNINSAYWGNFDLYSDGISFGTCYDYYSVMHYGLYDFATDSSVMTMIPKDPSITHIDNREMSEADKFELNAAYDCPGRETVPPPCTFLPSLPAGSSVTFNETACRDIAVLPSIPLSKGDYVWTFDLDQDTCKFGTIEVTFADAFDIPTSDQCVQSWLRVTDSPRRVFPGMESNKICSGARGNPDSGPPAVNPMVFESPVEPVTVFFQSSRFFDVSVDMELQVCATCHGLPA